MKNAKEIVRLINKGEQQYTYNGKKVNSAWYGIAETTNFLVIQYDEIREARCAETSGYYPIITPQNELKFVTEILHCTFN